jgi:small subunit ribosomal protein S20
MANIRSAEKQRRQAEKARSRNRATTSRMRTAIKDARKAIDSASGTVNDVLSATFSAIDRAAKRNVIKRNTASRYKARLTAAAKKKTAAAK